LQYKLQVGAKGRREVGVAEALITRCGNWGSKTEVAESLRSALPQGKEMRELVGVWIMERQSTFSSVPLPN
jgi:hypothetical protein